MISIIGVSTDYKTQTQCKRQICRLRWMGLMENRGMLEERADSIEKAQALLDIAGRGTE